MDLALLTCSFIFMCPLSLLFSPLFHFPHFVEGDIVRNCDLNVLLYNFLQLHLGVNSGALKFAIEQQAVNEATFRCPDELGWQPQVNVSVWI